MTDRAKYIQLAVSNGVTDINNIRDTYNTYSQQVNKYEDGGNKTVNYYDPITGQSFGSTIPEGKVRVNNLNQLTEEAQNEYRRNHPTNLDEVVVTAQSNQKNDIGWSKHPVIKLANKVVNSVIGTYNYLSPDSKKPAFIDLSDKELKELSREDRANAVLTNEFVEHKANNVRKAKDYKNTTDTLIGDRGIKLSNISQFYGIEEGKLKVGNLDTFNDETTVIPVRNRNVGKIKEVLSLQDSVPNYMEMAREKYPNPNIITSLLASFGNRDSREEINKTFKNRGQYIKYLRDNNIPATSYNIKDRLKGVTENNDTIDLQSNIKYNNGKILFSDEEGNSIFVNSLADKDVRDKLNERLETQALYPILVDNGRYRHYDLNGNIEGYVNPLDNKEDMYILGYRNGGKLNKFIGGGDLFGVTPQDVPIEVRAAMAGVDGAKEAYYEQQRKEANRNPHQTFKDIASFAPIVGTGIDLAEAINKPSMENWAEVGVSAASDLFMLKWIKGLSSLPFYRKKVKSRGISAASRYLSPEATQGMFVEAPIILIDQAKNIQDIKENNK